MYTFRNLCRLIVPVAVLLSFMSIYAHVDENSGEALQLYSYFTSSPPMINACLTDKTNANGVQRTDNDEWKDAYIRYLTIKTSNENDSTKMAFFFMNDADYLYVGVSCNFNNMGNNTTVKIFFDQGNGGGSHNDALDGGGNGVNNGEYRCEITTDSDIKNEYSWNGTAWAQQNNGSEVFEASGENYGGALMQVEFKIPITGNPAVSDNASYLDVGVSDELGLFINIYSQNSGGLDLYWHDTNGDINDAASAPGWTDLRLGVNRSYVTFYSTFNANGDPTVDGNIVSGATPDDAWRGCYTRNLKLTNFNGLSMDAVMYLIGNETNDDVYVGMKIVDDDNDGGDYLQIYQEENTANPSTGRNFLLGNNAENALKGDDAYGAGDDLYWNGSAWTSDGATAPDYADQNAARQYYSTYWEYEFELNRSSGNANDINMQDNREMGFLIKYHDAEGAGTDYFWEYSPNVDAISIDENNVVYLAAGWPGLQLGAPYVQVIYPEDGSKVEGILNVRIYAVDEEGVGNAGIDSVNYYLASGLGSRTELTRIANTQEWSGTLDVSQIPNGDDTLVIEVGDNDGNVVERLVEISIANGSGSVTPPTVRVTSPSPGDTVSGTQTINISKDPGSGTVIRNLTVFIDGDSTELDSSATNYSWSTTGLIDACHTLQFRVINENGMSGISPVMTYITNNAPRVAITAPAAGADVTGRVPLTYTATPKGSAAIDSIWLLVDGAFSQNLAAGGNDTMNTTSLFDGEHTLQVRALDDMGKIGMSEIIIVSVNNSPTVTVTSPQGGAEVNGKVVLEYTTTSKGTAAIDSIWLLLDGAFHKSLDLEGTDTLNTMSLVDGEHTILVRAKDNTGKTGESEILTLVIRNAPSVVITSPEGGATVSGKLALLYTNYPMKDAYIVSDSLFVDGRAYASLDTGGVDTLITTDLKDGEHTIQIKVTDNNGKTGLSKLLTLFVRNSPTVTLDYPLPDAILTGTVTLKFTESPVLPAAIVKREIYIDGGYVDTAATDSTYIWNTQDLNDGQHTIQVKVTDTNDRVGLSSLISVTVFNTPVVNITGPSDTAEISGVDTITFTVDYAPGTDRDSTEISFNGGQWIPTTEDLAYTWVTTDFLDGNHTVQVRARATNGKTGFSQVASFKVSNVPYVNITAPTGGEALNGTYTVTFITSPVYPATITNRQVSIDGNSWSDSLVDSASYTMTTTGWEDGVHTIQIRAVDSRGRSGFSSIRSFVVDNSPPVTADPSIEYPGNNSYANINSDILITVLVKDIQVGLRTDSGVVLSSDNIDISGSLTCLMRDDGLEGDKVADDNIFSYRAKINTDTTGTIGYSIKTEDRLGNTKTLTSAIKLDNTPPEIVNYIFLPEPEITVNPAGMRTYFDKLIARGEYSDDGGAGLNRVFIAVKNDSGNHVNNSPIEMSPGDSLFSRILNLVTGVNFITIEAADNAGNVTAISDTITYIEPKATKVIEREGGTVTSPNGVQAEIPKDAMLNSTEITITKILPIDQPQPVDKKVKLLNVAHEFGPDGMSFRKPITITLSYTEADLDPDQDGVNDFNPDDFIIVFWDGETWLNAGDATVDTANCLVMVNVNHFTTYDIAEKRAVEINDLVTYWTHNPVKAQDGSYFNYDIPDKGRVGLSIIDMAGDLVYQLIAKDTPVEGGNSYSVGWRGQNVSERFAGAGLYVYVFTYKNSVSGKTTIIRKPVGLLK